MNIDDYLKQLQNDIDKQMESLKSWNDSATPYSNNPTNDVKQICKKCGQHIETKCSFCPYCGNSLTDNQDIVENDITPSDDMRVKPLYRLPRFDELEEESKAKIGTFEKIYTQIYEQETQRKLRDRFYNSYDTLDYAPLINPLASALEIELYASIYQLICNNYGKDSVLNIDATTSVDLGKKYSTLRDYQLCIKYDCQNKKALHRNGFNSAIQCCDDMLRIIVVRNKADHKEKIDKKTFLGFYHNVYHFFDRYMPALLALKQCCKDSNTCDIDEKAVKNKNIQKNEQPHNKATNPAKEYKQNKARGIIFTNSEKLTNKSLGTLADLKFTGLDFYASTKDILNNYCEYYKKVGVNYVLFDLAEHKRIQEQCHSWQDYSRALDNFKNEVFPGCNEPIALFIIGGDDVIPMPRIKNPFFIESGNIDRDQAIQAINANKEYLSERELEADMLYAYDAIIDKNGSINYNSIINSKPKYWIGRLAMENGELENADFLEEYLLRVLNTILRNENGNGICNSRFGINVNKHLATACKSAKNVSQYMLKSLPISQTTGYPGYIEDGIITSPILNIDEANFFTEDYVNRVRDSDMLTFMLHGNEKPSNAHFMGEDKKDAYQKPFYGFSPDLFKLSKAKVVSGLCCWGARYNGFPKVQSALLTALNSNVLLYAGACRSARGTFDNLVEKYLNTNNQPITLSQILLKYYLDYLTQGYDAGEAMGRAKMLYMSHPDTDILDVLATVLEFNLFGDPMLYVVPMAEFHDVEPINSNSDNRQPRSYKLEYSKKDEENQSLLHQVRTMVDSNLMFIRETLNRELYEQLGIRPEELSTIHSFSSANGKNGYRFEYCQSYKAYNKFTYVDTDSSGKINNIIATY